MARRVAALVLGCSLSAFLSARAGDPVEPLRLERLLGPDAIACVRIDTRLATWEGPVRATAMGRLAAEPEVAQALEPVWRAAAAAFAPSLEFKNATPTAVPRALRWVLAALRGLSGELSVAWRDGPSGEPPRLAALLDFGSRLSEAVAFLEEARGRFAWGGDPSVEPVPPGRAPEKGMWRVWVVAGPGAPLIPIHVRVFGTALLASTDASWLEHILATGLPTGPVAESLEGSDAFVRLRARTGGADAAAWAYLDLALVRERFAGGGPTFGGAIGDALGLRAWRGVAYGLAFDGERMIERIALDAPRAGGLLGLFAQGTGASVGLDLAPRSTLVHAELGLGLAAALGRATAMLERLDPDEAADLRRWLDGLEGASRVNLERDLLGRFTGREAAWLAFPPTGGLVPEIAFAARVREPEAFERALERLLDEWLGRASAGGDLLATARTLPGPAGTRLHVIDLDRPPGDGVAPFTPTWAVVGDRLVVTLVPHAMREVLARAHSGAASLRDDPAVAGPRVAPGADGDRTADVFLDTGAALRCLYDTGAPLLQTARESLGLGLPSGFDPATLPATRTVAPYLRSTRAAVRIDVDGADLAVTAPLPPIALSLAALLFRRLTDAAPPPPHETSATAAASVQDDPEARTFEVLERVAAALAEHRARLGAWPDRLEDLVESSRLLAAVPVDGWGRPLLYARGPRPDAVTVRSPGPDGRAGTEDDRTREADAAER